MQREYFRIFMSALGDVKNILGSVLQLSDSGESLTMDSPLIGAIPEFDSMAVVSVLTSLEEHYGFFIDDDEIDANDFETIGSLVNFVDRKLSKGKKSANVQ
jgi:acyl carrier protein